MHDTHIHTRTHTHTDVNTKHCGWECGARTRARNTNMYEQQARQRRWRLRRGREGEMWDSGFRMQDAECGMVIARSPDRMQFSCQMIDYDDRGVMRNMICTPYRSPDGAARSRVIWYSLGSAPAPPSRSPGPRSTWRTRRRSASRSRPAGSLGPIAVAIALCSVPGSPIPLCAAAPLAAWSHPREPRGSPEGAWFLHRLHPLRRRSTQAVNWSRKCDLWKKDKSFQSFRALICTEMGGFRSHLCDWAVIGVVSSGARWLDCGVSPQTHGHWGSPISGSRWRGLSDPRSFGDYENYEKDSIIYRRKGFYQWEARLIPSFTPLQKWIVWT